MVKDLEGLVHQRAQDIMASRRRIQSLVRDLKTRQVSDAQVPIAPCLQFPGIR